LKNSRESIFRNLVDRYRQANKLGELGKAKDLLHDITKLYPEASNVEHQRAQIFILRIESRERALRASKE
jgi:hypothetical protein